VSAARHEPDRLDAELLQRRRRGETWSYIAGKLGISQNYAIERGASLRAAGHVLPSGQRKGAWKGRPALRMRLIELWHKGHSTEEIGRRLGVTKNAVVGAAHRLDLPARPSPIRRSGEPKSEHRRPGRPPVPRATLPPLASQAPVAAPSTDHGWRVEPLHQKPGVGRLDTAGSPVAPRAPALGSGHPVVTGGGDKTCRVIPPAAPLPARYGRVTGCAWPLDDWRRPGRFVPCDAPSLPGRPYCGEHCERAYQRAPTRREDAHA